LTSCARATLQPFAPALILKWLRKNKTPARPHESAFCERERLACSHFARTGIQGKITALQPAKAFSKRACNPASPWPRYLFVVDALLVVTGVFVDIVVVELLLFSLSDGLQPATKTNNNALRIRQFLIFMMFFLLFFISILRGQIRAAHCDIHNDAAPRPRRNAAGDPNDRPAKSNGRQVPRPRLLLSRQNRVRASASQHPLAQAVERHRPPLLLAQLQSPPRRAV
jgi:hypothetical protein